MNSDRQISGDRKQRARRSLAAPGFVPFALCLALASAACQSQGRSIAASDEEVQQLLDQAVSATQREDWSVAASTWTNVFDQRLEEDPEACLRAAEALAQMDDQESAAEILQRGLHKNPDHAGLLEAKGQTMLELGFRRSAEHSFERCIEVAPERVTALISLGRLRVDLDREKAAIGPLERALELGCSEECRVRADLARAHRAAGDPLIAWNLYSELLGPDGTRPQGNSAVREQAKWLVEAASLAAKPTVRAAQSNVDGIAKRWLDRAIDLDQTYTEAWFQRGVLAESGGKFQAAVRDYKRSLELDGDFLPALTNLACLFRRIGRAQDARGMLERAIDVEEDRQRKRALQNMLEACEMEAAVRSGDTVADH